MSGASLGAVTAAMAHCRIYYGWFVAVDFENNVEWAGFGGFAYFAFYAFFR
jgi:hypothetical protein